MVICRAHHMEGRWVETLRAPDSQRIVAKRFRFGPRRPVVNQRVS